VHTGCEVAVLAAGHGARATTMGRPGGGGSLRRLCRGDTRRACIRDGKLSYTGLGRGFRAHSIIEYKVIYYLLPRTI
jgi:hypothetical protein